MTPPNMEDLLALHLAELGLHSERQFAYAKGRRFKADFAVWQPWGVGNYRYLIPGQGYPGLRLCLIEVTGGIYSKQAHGSVTGVLKDNERLNQATLNGWKMLRFTPQQVESGEAKRMVSEALK